MLRGHRRGRRLLGFCVALVLPLALLLTWQLLDSGHRPESSFVGDVAPPAVPPKRAETARPATAAKPSAQATPVVRPVPGPGRWFRLIDANGRPQRRVRVNAYRQASKAYSPLALLKDVRQPPPPPRPADVSAVTDHSGEVRLAGLQRGASYVVRAEPSAPSVGVELRVLGDDAGPPAVSHGEMPTLLHTQPGEPLSIQVADEKKRGVQAFVQVVWRHAAAGGPVECSLSPAWIPTDATGRLTLLVPPPGPVTVYVLVPGTALFENRAVPVPYGRELLLSTGLEPGASVKGVVRSMAGEAIAGAWVRVRAKGWGSSWRRSVTSDAEGRFALNNVPGTAIHSSSIGRSGWVGRMNQGKGLPLQRGREVQLDVRLEQTSTVVGQVILAGGKALPGATVTYVSLTDPMEAAPKRSGSVTTDEGGAYRLADVLPGRLKLWVERPGGLLAGGGQGAAVYVEGAEPGRILVKDLFLGRGRVLSGQVLDMEGRPVRDATVSCRVDDQEGRVLSDERGLFRIEGVPSRGAVSIQASLDGQRSIPLRFTLGSGAGSADNPLVLELLECASLEGRFRQKNGARVPFATVELRGPEQHQVDTNDRFRFLHLLPGDYEIHTTLFGGGVGPRVEHLTLKPGEDRSGLTLRTPETTHVAGSVVDAKGRMVKGARVSVHVKGSRRGPTWKQTTDEGGQFSIQVPLGDLLTIAVQPPEAWLTPGAPLRQTVRSPTNTLEFRLPWPEPPAAERFFYATIHGTVRTYDGQPLAAGLIRFYEWVRDRRIPVADAAIHAGRFVSHVSLTEGSIDLVVLKGTDSLGRPIAVGAHWMRDVYPRFGPIDVRLDVGLPLKIRLKDKSGRGVAGAPLSIRQTLRAGEGYDPPFHREFEGATNAEGCLERHGMGPGLIEVRSGQRGTHGAGPTVYVESGSHWNELPAPSTWTARTRGERVWEPGTWPHEARVRTLSRKANAVLFAEWGRARRTSLRFLRGEAEFRYRARVVLFPRLVGDAMEVVLKEQGVDRMLVDLPSTLQPVVDAYLENRDGEQLRDAVLKLHGIERWSDRFLGTSGLRVTRRPDLPRRLTLEDGDLITLDELEYHTWIKRQALASFETLRILADAASRARVPLILYGSEDDPAIAGSEAGESNEEAFKRIEPHLKDGVPLIYTEARRTLREDAGSLVSRCRAYFERLPGKKKVLRVVDMKRKRGAGGVPFEVVLTDGNRGTEARGAGEP